jgi:hypothetical protein
MSAASVESAERPSSRTEGLLSLVIQSAGPIQGEQPVTVGIPFPRGQVTDPTVLFLLDGQGHEVPLQTLPLARWPDGSVKWLLLDFLLGSVPQEGAVWALGRRSNGPTHHPGKLHVEETPEEVVVDTGTVTFCLNRRTPRPLPRVLVGGEDLLDTEASRLLLQDPKGRLGTPRVERVGLEDSGPVRATVRLEGTFTGRVRCRFLARLCFFAGTGLMRVRLTLHNPNRARHKGGLWDLGDPGSLFFRDLSLELALRDSAPTKMTWKAEPGHSPRCGEAGPLEIYQDSSGGENWQSKNHLNRHGQVPCSFRGYRVRAAGREEVGLRASPVLSLQGRRGGLTVAVPEFWQQFPKALEAEGRLLRVRLFPEQCGALFELQGGEQKTHTVWVHFSSKANESAGALDWVHQPAQVQAPAEWYAASEALAPFIPGSAGAHTPLEALLSDAVSGPGRLSARREIIDEYGWRNYGEVFADHEAAYYDGPQPIVSHYNNQYDVVLGTLLHYLRTGETAWLELGDPLARHVIDIDIYHTDRDKAAYNGGLFWFTDHYKTAATCTHRTYSQANCRRGDRSYGGGPSSAHNFTTGLLHYYYLTGDPNARAAVVGLADWVLRMDDGRRNLLGLLDEGPTGLASATFQLEYQGPGRGVGNSVNALLDGWLVTGQRRYLDKAEGLIRRCIHPADDVAARDLLNVELRWSYTVCLSALARYLRLKAEVEELDFLYAYAQASLVMYATWMLDHELPYFDQVEKLEFPTEVWAAQELRKANVLRLAAAHAEEPLRSRFLGRGEELADRAWSDLLRFESRTAARALAIVMVEGLQDQAIRQEGVKPAPRPDREYDFGVPEAFVPQKLRVRAQLKTVRGVCQALLRLTNPRTWWRHAKHPR